MSSPKFVKSEMLASVYHYTKWEAANTVSTTERESALDCLYYFYTSEEIVAARARLSNLGVPLPKKKINTSLKDDVKSIFDAMRECFEENKTTCLDNVVFVAADLDRVCYCKFNVEEESRLQTEISCIQKRLENIEGLCMKAIKKKQLACPPASCSVPADDDDNKMSSKTVVDAVTYASAVTKSNTSRAAPLPTTSKPEDSVWKKVQNKKRKARPPILGKSESSSIKTVQVVKVTSVFVSRCDPTTTTNAVSSFLKGKNWKVGTVEKLKTKFNTYSSFRIDILRDNQPESEYLKPEHWPSNMLIKRYNRPKPWTLIEPGSFSSRK